MVGTKGRICIRYSGNGTLSKVLTSLSVAVKDVDADFDNVLSDIADSFADDDHSDAILAPSTPDFCIFLRRFVAAFRATYIGLSRALLGSSRFSTRS